jgi:hypothetical protein
MWDMRGGRLTILALRHSPSFCLSLRINTGIVPAGFLRRSSSISVCMYMYVCVCMCIYASVNVCMEIYFTFSVFTVESGDGVQMYSA